ncbi:MAG TPA: DUF5719 family protein [Sporichthya sp.]|nr:DUF5719 family protein [Sporichthya sp.]
MSKRGERAQGNRETRRRAATPDRAAGPKAAVAVAGGLALAALLAQVVGGSGAGSIEPIVDEIRTAELACPAPVVTGADARSAVTMVAPVAAAELAQAKATEGAGADQATEPARTGAATLNDLGKLGSAGARAKLGAPGRTALDVSRVAAPQLARGTGTLAPGLAAELVTAGRSGTARGLEALACAPASPVAWFVGASTTAGRRDRLVLTNPENIPATIDLRFWDENGPVPAPANSTGIDVPAQKSVSIPLDGMSPGHQRLGVSVIATNGRVSAALHDIDERGVQPRGVDWIAPTFAPARNVVLPGLPDGKLGRTLQLLVPGDTDAIVKVRVLTPDNSFAPAGLDNVEIKAGQVVEYDLAKAAETAASAVVVTSDRPVLAVVRLTRSANGQADIGYATAAPPLVAPAAIPAGQGAAGTATRLILAAPRGDAEVTLTLGAGGAGMSSTVKIPAGRAVLVDPVPKGGKPGAAYSILIAPGPASGPVYVARVMRGGTVDLTVTTVLPGRFTVSIPGIEPDLTAVVPQSRP